jgi:hypothetical protein
LPPLGFAGFEDSSATAGRSRRNPRWSINKPSGGLYNGRTRRALNGGHGAVSGLLRAKSAELLNSVADLITAEAECGGGSEA